jgi:2',3'-cyclic-nucleotide 2'-phosphodiesterase/3'-nucleotidase/5'-nucleotidase
VLSDAHINPQEDFMADFTLQLLHATDQEGAAPALVDAPNLSAVLNALEDDYENTLILSSGDLWLPGLFYSASAEVYGFFNDEGEFVGIPGVTDALINNALGIQAAAFGNHEFDQGTAAIRALLEANPAITGPGIGEEGYPGIAFPYLSANLDFSADPNLAELVVEDGQDVATIGGNIAKSAITVVGGEKIGIVGATTPSLPTISSPGEGVGVSPADPQAYEELAAIIQAEVDDLLAANPDLNKVILLAHMQVLNIEVNELAPRLTGVDIIIGGGSDTILANPANRLRDGDEAAGPYPIIQEAADGNPIAIVNTDGQYLYVGQLVVDFDANGILVEESIDPTVSGAYATDAAGVAALGAEGLTDPVITEVIEALNEVIADKERNIFGITDTFLNGRRAGGGLDGVRSQETNLGNLTADANLWYGQLFDETVQISIKNGGGIRESIGSVVTPPGGTEPVRIPPEANLNFGKPEGGITQTDVESVLAFNNGLTLVSVTVEELKDILEHTVSGATEENIDSDFGSFGQVAGVKFSFDIAFQPRETDPITGEEITPGGRIRSLALVDENGDVTDVLVQDGEIQGDPTRSFRMITLNFLADGGSGYPIPQTDLVDLVDQSGFDTGLAGFADTGSEQDALAEYLANEFPADNDPGTPIFTQVDTPRSEDERIQNLLFRDDTVLGDEGVSEPAPEVPAALTVLGTYATGVFDEGAAEINAYDPATQRLFVVNADAVTVDVLDISDPTNPTRIFQIDASEMGAGANSVAVSNGILAVAIENPEVTDNGFVAFYDTDGNFLTSVEVGALPDMVTFTPDGTKVLVANEGEPNSDYSVDPEGSVSIIDISNGVSQAVVNTAEFSPFNGDKAALQAAGVKLFGPEGTTVAQDVEPEYIALNGDGSKAWVTLQENNAVAQVDVATAQIEVILPLGAKDFSIDARLDASNEDGAINLQNWPVFGLYQPDAIASYTVGNMTYYVTANEGDARIRPDGDIEDEGGNVITEEGAIFNEEDRIEDITLDPDVFPNAEELQLEENLGRLKITNALGDIDGDEEFEELYSFGARSFSIWNSAGTLVFDSGDDFETITASLLPDNFNSTNDENGSFDNRSDDKGPEPEGVVVGEVNGGTYAFIGLERIGGIMVYDITNPAEASFVDYINNRNFDVDAVLDDGSTNPAVGDLGPEGLTFIAAADSPTGEALLAVSNEISGTTTLYQINLDGSDSGSGSEETMLTFENLEAGTVVTDQISGLVISTSTEFGAMVFDSANPTGGDSDLFSETLGNVLIISEDGDSSDPDDNATGGTMTFDFDGLVNVSRVGVIDIEEADGVITFYGEDDSLISTVTIPALSNNSYQDLDLGVGGVARMDVTLASSGALDNLIFSPEDGPFAASEADLMVA